jgi:amino acid transporter
MVPSSPQRVLSFSDVVAYGLVFFVPIAPMAVFGLVYNAAAGMVALVYLVAAIAMVFSALSYSQMAKEIPLAGSVYSYVTIGANPVLGFVAGWALLLDYILLPALLAILGAAALSAQFPEIPTLLFVLVFVAIPTVVNLMGIALNARLFAAQQLIMVPPTREQLLAPLYNPGAFSWVLIFAAVPIAALGFIGFDAVSTLNEEAKGGGETVSRATLALLVIVTFLFVGQVYLAAVFVPQGTRYEGAAADTAFYRVSTEIVGNWFLAVITLTSGVVASLSNALVAQSTTARVLYSMSRDKRLPAFLGKLHARTKSPSNAVVTVALLSFVIGAVGARSLEVMVTLVTFGALMAYLLLHVAVIQHFRRLGKAKVFLHMVSPAIGIALLGCALWTTNDLAKMLGLVWMTVGLVMALVLRKRGVAAAA